MNRLQIAILSSAWMLFAPPAAACPPSFGTNQPVELLTLGVILTMLVGWMGAVWTTATNWRFRHKLGFWRMSGIALLAAPALGLIAVSMIVFHEFVDQALGLSSRHEDWLTLFAIGMIPVFQTGFSLGAYRLFRKRELD